MGILNRVMTVIKSNVNELINKAEDPKKMLDQIIMDMSEQLEKAKREVAVSIGDEKKLKREYLKHKEEVAGWEKKAEFAVNKGDDSLALKVLERQEESKGLMEQYEREWEGQREAVEKLKVVLKELTSKIEEARRKKNLLIARQKRAEAQSKIAKTMGSLKDSSAFDSFARMESKVESLESRAEGEAELQKELSGDNLEDQFKKLEADTNIQDKLAQLKAKMEKKSMS